MLVDCNYSAIGQMCQFREIDPYGNCVVQWAGSQNWRAICVRLSGKQMREATEVAGTLRLSTRDPRAFLQAVEFLRQGEPIAFPTDTVYGIGAHAFSEAAVTCLYRVKARPAHLPIPVLLPDTEAMEAVCTDPPPLAWRVAELFWPGGLSLILRRSPAVPDVVTAGGPTVAVRVPDHAFVRELCRLLEAPLAATSANLHGQPPPITADGVEETLGGQIPLLLDGGTCSGGIASTVLDLTVWPPAILRHGPVTALQLAAIMPLAGGPNGSSA
jgi:L-threonylcarbamoyladenylate synthase